MLLALTGSLLFDLVHVRRALARAKLAGTTSLFGACTTSSNTTIIAQEVARLSTTDKCVDQSNKGQRKAPTNMPE